MNALREIIAADQSLYSEVKRLRKQLRGCRNCGNKNDNIQCPSCEERTCLGCSPFCNSCSEFRCWECFPIGPVYFTEIGTLLLDPERVCQHCAKEREKKSRQHDV